MSSITQALAEKDRALYGKGADFISSKVVSTGKQQRGGPRLKSGTDLWKLKHCQPFGGSSPYLEARAKAEGRDSSRPPSFEEYGAPGWLYNKERKLFFHIQTGKTYWVDPKDGRYKEVYEGQEHDFNVRAEGHGQARGGRQGRYAIITDLHEAAAVLKLDLDHLDRPAAYFATFGCDPSAAPAEAAAKSLHSRLLAQLARSRNNWSDGELQAVLADCFQQPAQGGTGPSEAVEAAVVLVLGGRLLAATSGSALGALACVGSAAGQVTFGGSSSSSGRPATIAVRLAEGVEQHAVISCGRTGLSAGDAAEAARTWLCKGRCRAGCMELLQRSRAGGAEGPLVAAALRLSWGAQSERAAKRPRSSQAGSQVRCRHILVRHSACKQPQDPVRNVRVVRSPEEAEALLLQALLDLDVAAPGGDGKGAQALQATFTARCRALSECTSSLKGGELAGDLGWLDPAKQSIKAPAPIAKVAVSLLVGQLSDVVVTELGLHVLLRTA